MELENILNKVADVKSSITDKLSDWKTEFLDDEKQSIIKEFKENGKERINQILIDLDGSTKLIETIGYQFSAFSIDLGIPPSLTLSFDLLPVKVEKAEAKIPDDTNQFLKIILQALLRTNAISKSLTITGFSCKQVIICLGFIPDISVSYKRDK